MSIKSRKNRGFTLVELMIVVAIVGILAALAIYGVRRYIANAKSAEARNTIGQIMKDATTAFAKDTMAAVVIAPGQNTARSNNLCLSSTAVPAAVPAGAKYQSASTDWGGSATAGWQCLHFSMSDPQYYQYQYNQVGVPNAVSSTFNATATGDLDGNLLNSTFVLAGQLQQASGGTIEATVAPTIAETNPDE